MATWEDGPEYAPLQRPTEFSPPPGAPLETGSAPAPVAPPPPAPPPPVRPTFTDPADPVAPLATIDPAVGPDRDPTIPFDVASATVTPAGSAWGAVHWSATPAASPTAGPAGWPPASQPAWPAPAVAYPASPAGQPPGPALPLTHDGGAPAPRMAFPAPYDSPPPAPLGPAALPPPMNGFPAPGTPQWFGPGPHLPPPPPAPVTARRVVDAATPGLCVTLAIGGLISLLAPVTLAVAFVLAGRVSVARDKVRHTFRIAFALLGVIGLLAALGNDGGFSDWWTTIGRWCLAASWIVLVTVLIQITRELKSGFAPAAPGPWG